jgi:hypothetical protein
MPSQNNMERLARAIGRRAANPPSDATREQHLAAITDALTNPPATASQRRFGWATLPRLSHSGLRSWRLAPAFAAVVLLLAIVVTPVLRGSGADLPILSAAQGGDRQAIAGADALMERGGADSAPDIMWWPVQYQFSLADGVSFAAGSAPAWRLEVAGSRIQRANDLAALFGLASAGPSEWDRDVLIAGDEAQRSVTLYPSGEWYYGNYGAYPQWSCSGGGGVSSPPSEGESDAIEPQDADQPREMVEPDECTPPPPATNLPSTAAVQQQARELFAAVGITDIAFEAPYRDEWTVSLWGSLRFAELPEFAGQGVSVTFGNNGEILGAYGTLARPVRIGEYPTISAAEAVERLNAQFASDGGPGAARPLPAIDGGDMPVSDTALPEPDRPDPADKGERELHDVTLVSVALVSAPVWTKDGVTVIAPHYRFTDTDGQEWWVAAVTDRYLEG